MNKCSDCKYFNQAAFDQNRDAKSVWVRYDICRYRDVNPYTGLEMPYKNGLADIHRNDDGNCDRFRRIGT